MLAIGMPGLQEILIVAGAIVLIFGARKAPALAYGLGNSLIQFKKGLKDEKAKIKEIEEDLRDAESG